MYKPIDKDEVLKLVRLKGPLIPINLRKDLDTDTILIGAVLSQLIAEGKLKVSTVKIGGSPLYYAPGSEDKLVGFIRYLNEKDRRTAEMLQEKKLMKDSEQDPLVRVCLRNIKDYARPLEVNIKGKKEIYWKWYLLSTQEAEQIILKELKPKERPVIREEEKQVKRPVPEQKEQVPTVKEEKKEEKAEERPVKKERKAKKEEKKETKQEEKPEPPKREFQRVLAKPNILLDEEKDAFFNQVRKFLDNNEIGIIDYKIVKKAEIDLFIAVPTKLGVQEYFCKAKNKKKISDADLSGAYLQGQQAKLPAAFLSPGEMSKKAKELLGSQLKGMVVKRI